MGALDVLNDARGQHRPKWTTPTENAVLNMLVWRSVRIARRARGNNLKSAVAPVLVVEDDSSIREGMAELLEEQGFAVATAEDGRAALDQLQKGLRPCVILLDLMMPRMDGWDFRAEQTKDPALREIATVVLTGSGYEPRTLSKQLGGIEVVRKPVNADDLVAMVQRASKSAG